MGIYSFILKETRNYRDRGTPQQQMTGACATVLELEKASRNEPEARSSNVSS